jgi:tRNA (adenine22-N1)-methyltransferase
MIPECGLLADIGCDHGYIPIDAVQKGKAQKAVACDIKEGPLERAKKNIEKAGLEDRIDGRLCPGLEGLEPGEADVIVIAGMGMRTIAEILTEGEKVAKAAKYLILQPQSEIPEMREFLKENGYNLIENKLMTEGDKYYFAMLVSSSETAGNQHTGHFVELLRQKNDIPEFDTFVNVLDSLFGLDLIYTDKEMGFYLRHVVNEWGEAIEKMSEAKKPDAVRIAELAKKKNAAELALELNTLFCGIDKRLEALFDMDLLSRAEEDDNDGGTPCTN